jgi:hypothetical protein
MPLAEGLRDFFSPPRILLPPPVVVRAEARMTTMELMVRYRVKADRAQENEAAVRAVFAQLERERPEGIRYATFKLADGVSFVHIARIETADGKNPLLALEAFRQFSATIKERCEEPPVSTPIEEVGSYRLFERGRGEGA